MNSKNIYEDDPIEYEYPPADVLPPKKNKAYVFLGIIVTLFAIAGVAAIIYYAVSSSQTAKQNAYNDEINGWSSFLIPVAAVDPDTFDDVTTASVSQMIEISIWSIIGSDLDPSDANYSSGELAIPIEYVEQAFVKYFGYQVPITHQTVEGYGFRFEYSEDNKCYFIPLTGISPVYTPDVISVDNENGVKTILCGLVYASAWQMDHKTGQMVMPDPDKYITVTVREQSGGSYISAIRTAGKPETAVQ